MYHITFGLHVYDLTCQIQRWRGQWWGEGDKAAKPMTAVQDCVSTFISLKPVDILKETIPSIVYCEKKWISGKVLRHLQLFWWQQIWMFLTKSQDISSRV